MNNVKILIPSKTKSVRFPNKNFMLLPYTLEWLKTNGLEKNAIIIGDSKEMEMKVKELGVDYFEESSPEHGDIIACRDCAVTLGLKYFFWLPLTQPLREDNILNKMFVKFHDCDFVTTAQYTTNRSIFYISNDGKFKIDSNERCGSLCEKEIMLDGSAYLVKTEWLKNINTNEDFWKGNFNYVIHNSLFLDIDTENDFIKLLNIKKQCC